MKKTLYFIVLLVIASIACGVQSSLTSTAPSMPVSNLVETLPTQIVNAELAQVFIVCNSGGLRLRSAAGTFNEELEILADGETVSRTNTPAEYPAVIAWYEVVAESGLKGWVMSKYLYLGTKCK